MAIFDEDERDMEKESSSIYGLINLLLMKKMQPINLNTSVDNIDVLNYFGVSRKLSTKLVKGFMEITLNKPEAGEKTNISIYL